MLRSASVRSYARGDRLVWKKKKNIISAPGNALSENHPHYFQKFLKSAVQKPPHSFALHHAPIDANIASTSTYCSKFRNPPVLPSTKCKACRCPLSWLQRIALSPSQTPSRPLHKLIPLHQPSAILINKCKSQHGRCKQPSTPPKREPVVDQ